MSSGVRLTTLVLSIILGHVYTFRPKFDPTVIRHAEEELHQAMSIAGTEFAVPAVCIRDNMVKEILNISTKERQKPELMTADVTGAYDKSICFIADFVDAISKTNSTSKSIAENLVSINRTINGANIAVDDVVGRNEVFRTFLTESSETKQEKIIVLQGSLKKTCDSIEVLRQDLEITKQNIVDNQVTFVKWVDQMYKYRHELEAWMKFELDLSRTSNAVLHWLARETNPTEDDINQKYQPTMRTQMNEHVKAMKTLGEQHQNGIDKLDAIYNEKIHLAQIVKRNGEQLANVNSQKQKFATLQTTLKVIQETTHSLDPFFASLDLYADKLKELDAALHQLPTGGTCSIADIATAISNFEVTN